MAYIRDREKNYHDLEIDAKKTDNINIPVMVYHRAKTLLIVAKCRQITFIS